MKLLCLLGADRAWGAAFYAGDVRGGYCVLQSGETGHWIGCFFDTLIKKDEMMECKNREILETLALCVSIVI